VLIAAGILGACQIGKAAVAVPLLQRELGLTLVAAAWVVGAYGTLAAVAGLPAGIGVARFGARRAVVCGLLGIGLGSSLGAFATSGSVLLACRVLEGCGFLAVVIGVPTLLRGLTAERHRSLAFTLWAAYLPGGSAAMMLAGPLLSSIGWQALWLANGAAALAYAAVVWIATRGVRAETTMEPATPANGLGIVTARGPRLLALAFGTYTFQYFALTGLLPALLVERMGLSLAQAGAVSAMTVVANAIGNLAAGVLSRWAIPLWAVIATAFACMGAASVGIFAEGVPVAVVAALASASLAITGLIPASIFIAAPALAPRAPMLAVTLGLIMQASNLGQVLGPAALALWAQQFGWGSAPILFVTIALIGIGIAARLRHLLQAAWPR
jgi:DHA1 family inner membrane transport protein